MTAFAVCDGCGKQEEMFSGTGDNFYHKPLTWRQRRNKGIIEYACCPECVEKLGEAVAVLPTSGEANDTQASD